MHTLIKRKKRSDVIQELKNKGFQTMSEICKGGAVTDLAKGGPQGEVP